MSTHRLFPATVLLALLTLQAARADDDSIRHRFIDPPSNSRILKIIHGWPDDAKVQDDWIDRLSRQGFGGVVSNVSFTNYLQSESRWEAFQLAIGKAREAGWTLWLYDERGYPSGNAGGQVLKDHPEWEAEGLLIALAETEGEAISLNAPPGEPFLVAAFPERDGKIDVADKVDLADSIREGKLDWRPTESGRWRILLVTRSRLYDGTHAETNYSDNIPYPNLLSPEPTKRFIELTHKAYAEHLGPDLGKIFQATFTDEPSLLSFLLIAKPYRVLPWSPTLAAEFRDRRGYSLEPIIPELIVDGGSETGKHRHDFWLTVGELISENYFGQLQTWGREHNIPSGGHLFLEEGIAAHPTLYGDMFRCLRRMDAPGIDCLTSLPPKVPWYSARLAASAGELEGNELVMSETSDHEQRYRPKGDDRPPERVSEAQIRGTCNRLMVAGVNCITSYYSFDGLDDEALSRLNSHVGRCATMIRGGNQVADVAVVYPIESLWPRFVPSGYWTRDAGELAIIETNYRQTLGQLFMNQRDMTIIDSRAILDSEIEGDALVHGKLRWRVVVLPGVDTLPLAAWEKLERFAEAGGVVVAVGARPENGESRFPDPRALNVATRLFGAPANEPTITANGNGGGGVFLPHDSAPLLPMALQGVIERDADPTQAESPLRATHRSIDGREIYLVINDSDQPVSDRVRFASAGGAELWDPASGTIAPAAVDGDGRIPIELESYGAVVVRFDEPRTPKRFKLSGESMFARDVQPLPETEPSVGHGEFVRSETIRETSGEPGGAPAWTFRAVLTKGDVDAHLFARFPHHPTLDLTGKDCLVIDTWAPPKQATSALLLVILQDETGADFIAETARHLGSPGNSRSYVPLSSFERAGWSVGGGERPDASRIREIRVGWGGYFGSEGETIEFRVDALQTATVAPTPK